MDLIGVIILVIILLIALAVAAAGIIFCRRRPEWYFKALGIIGFLLGIIAFLTIVIGVLTSNDPFKVIFVQIGVAVGLAISLFWVAMLIEAALYEKKDNERLLWVIIIIFTNLIGALIYLLARRPQRISETGK